MINKQTTLDLNGPILSFNLNPVGVASTGTMIGSIGGGSVTLTGIATATFANSATNTGVITYRWYEVGVGALENSTYVTGTATTSLTISNLITPTDNKREFYLVADYIPSAYSQPTGSDVTAATARSTGNAINEPISSGIGTITVFPLLEIVSQPSSVSALLNQNAKISVNAGLTDDSFTNDLTYQWYLDGQPVNDGNIVKYETVTTTTTTTTYQTINQIQYRTVTSTNQRSENRTFTSDGSVDLHPSSTNIVLEVASGSGGRGGDDNVSGGAGGAGRWGRFTYNSGGRRLDFKIGRRGNDGSTLVNGSGGGNGGSSDGAAGGRGGNTGTASGERSGGGGGGGGATVVFDSSVGRQTIIAAGGSGGGGGSFNFSGRAGANAGGFNRGDIRERNTGSDGQNAPSIGGGGGGGQGGGSLRTTEGGSGQAGQDSVRSAEGGGAMYGAYDSSVMTFNGPGTENYGDGYVRISWNWTETVTYQEPYTTTVVVPVETTTTTTNSVPRTITLSGTKTPTLTLKADVVGINTVFCNVSSKIAGNSTLSTNESLFRSVSSADQYNVNIETIGTTNTASISSVNLFNGEYTFTNTISGLYSFYAPDRDIVVEMDLYGGKGDNVGSFVGGEGGFSRIKFTLQRNVEYIIAGLLSGINTPFIYRKGSLIATVGAGGNAGTSGKGGFGGGIGISGQTGSGRDGGIGGASFAAGTLPSNGVFGSLTSLNATSPDTKAVLPNGGRTLPCPRGVYWRQQGLSACSDITGSTQFRLSDGTIVTNTGSIARGYKAGYSIIETAGASSSNGGRGGAGATGGNGGTNGAGGGGGSGYTNGSVVVVNTQLGGSTGPAKVIMRVIT